MRVNFKVLAYTVCFVCYGIIISCNDNESNILSSDYFIGQWDQEFEYWALNYFGIDTLTKRDTFEIEFLHDGTCLQKNSSTEKIFDWFYRESPRQIYFTEVGQVWPDERLYDIIEKKENYQYWERRIESSSGVVYVEKYYLHRR